MSEAPSQSNNDNMNPDKSKSTQSTRNSGNGSQSDKKTSPALGFLGDTASGNIPKDKKSR